MKICQTHWTALKEGLESRNLTQFIAKNSEAAFDNIKLQLDSKGEEQMFDPLMNANFAIWNIGLSAGGMYLLGQDENGNEYCPICESEKHGGYPAEWWITGACDEQLQKAKGLGLLT